MEAQRNNVVLRSHEPETGTSTRTARVDATDPGDLRTLVRTAGLVATDRRSLNV